MSNSVLVKLKDKTTSIVIVTLLLSLASCASIITRRQDVRPRALRDVPAQRLAYRFEPDVQMPPEAAPDDADKIEAIQLDFTTRREEDALIRTVRSPDGQRAIVLYAKAEEPTPTFHLDLYSADGQFIRNVTPPDLSCVFPETVSWSPDGNFMTFIAHRADKPSPSPTPLGALPPEPEPQPNPSVLPSVAPAFALVQGYETEQVYICNRDGYDLKPLTSREGLIYFYAVWAPDNHALVAMACRESEWDAREREYRLPTGRPRLLTIDGAERLLDDRLTEALPVWSPDASKVSTAFETDVMIYDAATNTPTQARIKLSDPLIAASRAYDAKTSKKAEGEAQPASDAIPASLNPIVRLEWVAPERLYFQTAYIRLIPNDPINTFQRWHMVALSPQAAVLR